MNNNISWQNTLGIGFEKLPKGRLRDVNAYGHYTELMNKYELWLRDVKGYTSYTQIQNNAELRSEFFLSHLESHPEWFSKNGLEKSDPASYQQANEYPYICKKCKKHPFNGQSLITHEC